MLLFKTLVLQEEAEGGFQGSTLTTLVLSFSSVVPLLHNLKEGPVLSSFMAVASGRMVRS